MLHFVMDTSVTADVCRQAFQYSPFDASNLDTQYFSFFHPVIYDLVLAALKCISLLYLIWFVRQQYHQINRDKSQSNLHAAHQHNPSTQSGLIFPLYLRILVGLTILCLYQAVIDIILPLNPQANAQNPLGNAIFHAAGSGLEHMILEGVSVLLIFQGVGKRTTFRTLLIAGFWALSSGALSWAINYYKWSHLTVSITNLVWAATLLAYYLALWLLPQTIFHRRPAVLPYARLFVLSHAVLVLSHLLLLLHVAFGFCTLHFTHHGIFSVVVPYIIYKTLINDSKYWQGVFENNDAELLDETGQSDDSIQGALVGITFDPQHARHVAKHMDKTSRVNMISFAAIKLEKNLTGHGPKHVILGAGSSARVYRGRYHDRPVAIKTIFCVELTQDVITSFYREASLLTKLRHENVVMVEGMCVNPPALCLVMQLCGGSLMDLLSAIFNNSHTNAIQGPKQLTGRQSTGKKTSSSGSGQDATPYFSYFTDIKQSETSKLKKHIVHDLSVDSHSRISAPNSSKTAGSSFVPQSGSASSKHSGNNINGTSSMFPTLISSASLTSTTSQFNPNIPILLTPQLIHQYYNLEYAYEHPMEFWKDLLRGENPITELMNPHSPINIASSSSTLSEIPLPVNLSPNDVAISWLSRIELMIQCCRAVAFLHQQSPPILHLDIKSSNFLLGFDGRVKLADLELSRHITMTKDGQATTRVVQTVSPSPPQAISRPSSTHNNPLLAPNSTPTASFSSSFQSTSSASLLPNTNTRTSQSSHQLQQLQQQHLSPSSSSHSIAIPRPTTQTSTAFLIDLLSEIMTNGPTHFIAHEMAYQSQFNGITIPERVNWLAPELMLGHQYSEKVDVYALACVLWEVVTGKVPFYDIELQLKQLVLLPRGVSSYYQRGSSLHMQSANHLPGSYNSTSSSSYSYGSTQTRSDPELPLSYSPGSFPNQQTNPTSSSNPHTGSFSLTSYMTNSQLASSTMVSATPKSSQFVSPLSQLKHHQQFDAMNEPLLGKGSDSDSSNQHSSNPRNPINTMSKSKLHALGAPSTATASTPTTEQIQATIKVLVAIHHYRPSIPIDTPKVIRELIELAWHPDPAVRPSAEHMVAILTRVKNDLLNDGGMQHIY